VVDHLNFLHSTEKITFGSVKNTFQPCFRQKSPRVRRQCHVDVEAAAFGDGGMCCPANREYSSTWMRLHKVTKLLFYSFTVRKTAHANLLVSPMKLDLLLKATIFQTSAVICWACLHS